MGTLNSNSKTYHAAVYLRLLREDGNVAESGRVFRTRQIDAKSIKNV